LRTSRTLGYWVFCIWHGTARIWGKYWAGVGRHCHVPDWLSRTGLFLVIDLNILPWAATHFSGVPGGSALDADGEYESKREASTPDCANMKAPIHSLVLGRSHSQPTRGRSSDSTGGLATNGPASVSEQARPENAPFGRVFRPLTFPFGRP